MVCKIRLLRTIIVNVIFMKIKFYSFLFRRLALKQQRKNLVGKFTCVSFSIVVKGFPFQLPAISLVEGGSLTQRP